MRKETPIPIYRKLLIDLKRSMDEGKYKKGDLLPSENELCRTYNTTRPTVRQALKELTGMGYIIRHHGKGSIVAEPKKGLGILTISGIAATIGDKILKTEILEKPQKQDWPSDFFYALNDIEQEAGCIYFKRLRHINNVPTLYEETFITNIDLPRFTSRNLEDKSLFKTLNEYYKVEVKEGEQKIWAVNADEPIAQMLNLNTGDAIVHLKRKLKTNIKHLHIYSLLYANTHEYYLQDSF